MRACIDATMEILSWKGTKNENCHATQQASSPFPIPFSESNISSERTKQEDYEGSTKTRSTSKPLHPARRAQTNWFTFEGDIPTAQYPPNSNYSTVTPSLLQKNHEIERKRLICLFFHKKWPHNFSLQPPYPFFHYLKNLIYWNYFDHYIFLKTPPLSTVGSI